MDWLRSGCASRGKGRVRLGVGFMHREYVKWYSHRLGRDMEMLVFGHGGYPLLVFPTSGGRFHEYEDRGMIGAVAPRIEAGGLQVYCVDSVDRSGWYNRRLHPADRARVQQAFDGYLSEEVMPYVRHRNWSPQRWATGCSLGGYHAVNFALRHPDLITYAVSMSGAFSVPRLFLDGYYDQNAYFHSPLDFLPNWNGGWQLDQARRNYFVMAVGEHDRLLGENYDLMHKLGAKGIPNLLDVWQGFGHDWPWWHRMARKFFL